MAIIDRFILFLFEPGKIVEIIFDLLRRAGGKRWAARPARLKFQYLAEWSGATQIGSLDNRLRATHGAQATPLRQNLQPANG